MNALRLIKGGVFGLFLMVFTLTSRHALANPQHGDVVPIITTEYEIQAPDSLSMGWNTFSFSNKGNQVHFVAMYRLADGKTIEDQLEHVVPVFETLMESLRGGELSKSDIGPFFEQNIPEWGLQMTWVGGVGLLSPGRTSSATFNIQRPGTYLVECYVKAPDGKWHTAMGMLKQIEVGSSPLIKSPPKADYTLTVTNSGVTGPREIPPGKYTFRINIDEDPDGFMPYDLNLAQLGSTPDLERLYFWMDWTNVGGLRAPAPVNFLGGLEHMRAGNHGYVTVDLRVGNYLWVSEVNAAKINLPFVVRN
ncbi:hypothetical protein OCL06_00015 [Alteromonas sp. ASW11-19]|uniref:Secreted protein n=1 Tax=Alteromonas salexigens TaxID=2982530 RepID=A0ABT2VJ51_9ALTE|nr:hypothetical protein [Alteromonas salexigens]MCU7552975.1 hypothetical protein [Alteromonas salexigens]